MDNDTLAYAITEWLGTRVNYSDHSNDCHRIYLDGYHVEVINCYVFIVNDQWLSTEELDINDPDFFKQLDTLTRNIQDTGNMTLTFSVVETRSSRAEQLLNKTIAEWVTHGDKLEITNNSIILDNRKVAGIIEYGTIFMTNGGNFNKLTIT